MEVEHARGDHQEEEAYGCPLCSGEPSAPGAPRVPSGGERDLIAERLAYAAGTGPEPKPDPTPPGAMAAFAPGLITGTPDA